MGSDAHIFLFDYERYVADAVPAVRRLLLRGEAEPWLMPLIERRHRSGCCGTGKRCSSHSAALRDVDLEQYCTYLLPDLGLNEVAYGAQRSMAVQNENLLHAKTPHYRGWKERLCLSDTCPAKLRCPFHEERLEAVAEDLNAAIIRSIERCLGNSQFVGRSANAAGFNELLDDFGVPGDHRCRRLLKSLAVRGLAIGYAWGHGEGIHGWLNPSETQQLVRELTELPLPQYAPGFEAMRELHRESMIHLGAMTPKEQKIRHQQWMALSLSFVRTVAGMAAEGRKGVLWGNDIGLGIEGS